MDYRIYQLDPKKSDTVSTALQSFIDRYGVPPEVLEHNTELPLPEGLTMVTRVVSIPKNILLLGVPDEEI